MEQDFYTPVIFRVFQGEVLALFVQDVGTDDSYTCSICGFGGHSSADPVDIIQNSRAATPDEYKDLSEELWRIGYKLAVRTRYLFHRDLQARRDRLKEAQRD